MAEKKAKRKLKDFDFSREGCHLALVNKEVGGAANGYGTLIMKSTAQFSEEFFEKAQKVRVEMELPDFLEKFFCVYGSDAQVLAQLMGYVPEEDQYEDTYSSYQDYIEERLESFEIIKSVTESESLAEGLSKLSEDQYLGLLRDQERLEKHLGKVDSAKEESNKSSDQPVVAEKSTSKARIIKEEEGVEKGHNKADVTDNKVTDAKAAENAEQKEIKTEVNKMTESVKVEKTDTVEMVEKAQFEVIEKALKEKEELLQKALEAVENFEKVEKERVAKARKDSLVEVLGEAEESVEAVMKALGEASQEDFDAVVGVIKAASAKTEESEMFQEKGVSVDGDGKVASIKDQIRANLEAQYK